MEIEQNVLTYREFIEALKNGTIDTIEPSETEDDVIIDTEDNETGLETPIDSPDTEISDVDLGFGNEEEPAEEPSDTSDSEGTDDIISDADLGFGDEEEPAEEPAKEESEEPAEEDVIKDLDEGL